MDALDFEIGFRQNVMFENTPRRSPEPNNVDVASFVVVFWALGSQYITQRVLWLLLSIAIADIRFQY